MLKERSNLHLLVEHQVEDLNQRDEYRFSSVPILFWHHGENVSVHLFDLLSLLRLYQQRNCLQRLDLLFAYIILLILIVLSHNPFVF